MSEPLQTPRKREVALNRIETMLADWIDQEERLLTPPPKAVVLRALRRMRNIAREGLDLTEPTNG